MFAVIIILTDSIDYCDARMMLMKRTKEGGDYTSQFGKISLGSSADEVSLIFGVGEQFKDVNGEPIIPESYDGEEEFISGLLENPEGC